MDATAPKKYLDVNGVPTNYINEGVQPNHVATITQDFLGDFTAKCSCDWSTEYTNHETRLQAQGAFDRHLGSTIGQ